MTNDAAETVTPDEATPDQPDNVDVGEYTTRGRTRVATRRGYEFRPSDEALPVVTTDGLYMTKEQAEGLVSESQGIVFIVPENDGE